ncbi:SET domain-containing protein 3 [Neonectria magnoliae]|uniref:SET domain-containing protein 3 n=1 Tax=Neonectria magnoliae TaxID=2732573 RepID=A0ABR1I0T7_9HYPO
MTDKPNSPPTQPAAPSQVAHPVPQGPPLKDDVAHKVETVEEEPYTIKCICNFTDDDGNTIYCETCDTWQHIDCFYPDNRDEAISEDFAHSCAECKPRPLDRQKAIERTLRLRNAGPNEALADKKTKRPPSKSHKKKPKPNELQINGQAGAHETVKHTSPNDHAPPPKKTKHTHRPSQSVGSLPSKRSPSYGNARSIPTHPPSPATTPPDLPEDFLIHHYSQGFYDLYNTKDVPDTHNNAFASLAIPTALSRWLREPDTMRDEVGRTHSEVFQTEPSDIEAKKPKLELKDTTRSLEDGKSLRWRFLNSTSPIDKDVPLIELNGEIGFQKDYCADAKNLWADVSSPLPFVFFHPVLPLYIDTRQEGSLARYVRRSCKPNAQLDTYLSDSSEYHFWIVSDRQISPNEQITLPWDFRLEKSIDLRWLHLLGLSEDDSSANAETALDETEYNAISNWIDRILSEYGGCACDLDNNCAFARFHRQYLFEKAQSRPLPKKKQRKPKTQAISPTNTSQATTSRAASEGHIDDGVDHDAGSQSGSSRSKPPSRDMTPLRQGSFDQLGILTEPTDRDKRKVAMVEDSFRRMEQAQPPRKKKRVSDGTNASTSSKTKPRTGSTVSQGNYVDSGTCRSKSGSPASSRSPNLAHKPSISQQESSVSRLRRSSTAPKVVYCNAAVQTDPVEGEWFSEPKKSPQPKKRIISLSKRLLNNRHKIRSDDEVRLRQSITTQISNGTDLDPSSPILEQKPIMAKSEAEPPSPVSQGDDLSMADAPSTLATTSILESSASDMAAPPIKVRTPDLRVQMPPVPAFDNTGLGIHNATTPQLISGSVLQSPLTNGNHVSPFAQSAANGVVAHPSPIKKKLSLSDYTKSRRMNKVPGKASVGTTMIKPSISSPEDTKIDIILDSPSVEKSGENVAPSTVAPTTNGAL